MCEPRVEGCTGVSGLEEGALRWVLFAFVVGRSACLGCKKVARAIAFSCAHDPTHADTPHPSTALVLVTRPVHVHNPPDEYYDSPLDEDDLGDPQLDDDILQPIKLERLSKEHIVEILATRIL